MNYDFVMIYDTCMFRERNENDDIYEQNGEEGKSTFQSEYPLS